MQHSSSKQTDELSVSTTLQDGEYTISDIKGSSNNSYNYHAKTSDGTIVAIKEFFLRDMCRREGNRIQVPVKTDAKIFANLVKTFLRDAAFLTSLESDHLARVLDLFEENGTAYMVKSIPNGTLLQDLIVDPSYKFTPKKVVSIAHDLARALVEVHGFGMLHRDITPSNIMITADESAVLLPDFGTFREDRSNASRVVSSVLHSAQNYAPFELTFDDARQGDGSDIYCVAAVIYHLIAGEVPAASLDRVAAVAAQDPDPYVPLEGSHKGYDDRFLKAIDMSMELFYDARVHSATELMFIMSKEIDFEETRRMKRDVGKRSTPLTHQGIFARVKNLLLRR